MSTFGTMVQRIREDLNRGSDFDSRIKQAICDAIVYYSPSRLGFNTKRSRALITSGMEVVALPTDWVESDYLRLEDNGDRIPFDEVTYDWIEDRRENDTDRGMPQKYAIQHREMRLWPIPDHSYTLVFSFQYELRDVSISASDGATNGWMTDAEQCVRAWAQGDVLINYVGGPEAIEKGLMLQAKAENVFLPKLEARAAREQSSGQVRGFL
jgi:hypothetical protein